MATKAALSMNAKIAELDRRLASVNTAIAGTRRRLLPHRLLADVVPGEAELTDKLEADLDHMLRRQTSLIEAREAALKAAMTDGANTNEPSRLPQWRLHRFRAWEFQAFGLTARLSIVDARDHPAGH